MARIRANMAIGGGTPNIATKHFDSGTTADSEGWDIGFTPKWIVLTLTWQGSYQSAAEWTKINPTKQRYTTNQSTYDSINNIGGGNSGFSSINGSVVRFNLGANATNIEIVAYKDE